MLKLKITGYADSTVRAYYDMFLVEGAAPLDEDDADVQILVSAYDPARSVVMVDEATCAPIRRALGALSNIEDDTHERERAKPDRTRDPSVMHAARHAAAGLSTLSSKVVTRFGAACFA